MRVQYKGPLRLSSTGALVPTVGSGELSNSRRAAGKPASAHSWCRRRKTRIGSTLRTRPRPSGSPGAIRRPMAIGWKATSASREMGSWSTCCAVTGFAPSQGPASPETHSWVTISSPGAPRSVRHGFELNRLPTSMKPPQFEAVRSAQEWTSVPRGRAVGRFALLAVVEALG
jgi:hypothetical protein